MRHHYTLFTVGLGVLLSFTACSPDSKSETRASQKREPAAPAATAASAPGPTRRLGSQPNGQPTSETDRRRNMVLAPAAPQAGPARVISKRTNRKLARLVRRQERAASRAAAAAPAPTRVAPAAPASAQPTPTNAGVLPDTDVAVAAAAAAPTDRPKTAQVFRIRPDRDTVLYGSEGTVMRVPAGTFVQGNTRQGTAPEGLVEIKLREFYSMADILLERLSTMAGPRLLETGGMVQLSATTADGRECKLKPGSAFELGFPATRPIDGMQLYNGQSTATRGLNWKLAPQHEATKPAKRWISWQYWKKPRFKGGYAVTRHRLSKAIDYDAATAMRLNGYQAPGQLRREMRRNHKRVPVVGRVNASFELSETGQLNDVYFRSAGPADSALQAAVVQALRRLKATPASHGVRNNRRATRSLMKVDVRFTADRRVLVDHLRWDQATTISLFRADEERRATGKGRLTDAQLQAAPLEAVTGELFKKRQANAKRYSVGTFLGEQLNYVKELAVFRVKVVAAPRTMGWYNCDRPAPPLLTRLVMSSSSRVGRPTGGLAKLALVHLGLEHPAAQPADISLVLHDKRCVIRGDAKAGRVTFEQLADSTVATLVAIRREQGQLYLGLRDVVVRQRVEPPLEFRPVTVPELRAAMARFDL
ncbi:hypothetical protein [Hymenobacter properus]|uniref:Uncharacterized protein n=1 Tax=Hymenobacter properus TaxID=2791026 RepID=A0A931FMV4_9BACT|nr:hypothetical protein [Hymenobacter properus]MBF9143476.1 hypothetical protein [Hymenobacter properus]MBR7722289.1 hypothetical protein [Microvirga sp. SRT04]